MSLKSQFFKQLKFQSFLTAYYTHISPGLEKQPLVLRVQLTVHAEPQTTNKQTNQGCFIIIFFFIIASEVISVMI